MGVGHTGTTKKKYNAESQRADRASKLKECMLSGNVLNEYSCASAACTTWTVRS